MNQYKISVRKEPIQFQEKIAELRQFREIEKINLYTEAGVNTTSRTSGCGIIIPGDGKTTNIKAKLLTCETKGASTAEHLSVALGLKLLKSEGITEAQIKVFNDNTEVIRTTNNAKSFKELVGDNGWGKSKLWQEKENHKSVAAEWSGINETRSYEEQRMINLQILKCHNMAHEEQVNGSYNEVNLSMMVEGKVEAKKIESSIRVLLRDKYVTKLLEEKYDTTPNKVYLESRRKAILKSKVCLVKT